MRPLNENEIPALLAKRRPRRLCCLTLCTAGLFLSGAARAELPSPDLSHVLTVQTENDSIVRTDRNYTAGIRLGWTSPNIDAAGAPFLPGSLTSLGNYIWGEGRQRLSLELSDSIFTPKDTSRAIPDPKDRPYAGVLMGSMFLIHDTSETRSILGVSLGVLGPSARAESIQNGFHELIKEEVAKGWSHQIKDMPVAQVFGGRIWRYGLTPNSGIGLDIDVLPALTAGVGTLRIFIQGSLQFRLGQGLDVDYGTSRIRPGLSGSDAFRPTREFSWYLFAGANAQALGWDAALDGNPFRSGPHVSRQPFMGEMEGGFAVIWRGVRIAYTHVAQTQQFYRQRGGLVQFGSIGASLRF